MRNAQLSPAARRTFVYHGAFSVLIGITSGVLVNAPTVAIKALRAADWHLALPTSLSGVGLLLSLVLGLWMARRPKMPFVLVPGFISCVACLAMAFTPMPLAFLFLLGLFNLFETITRPAMTAVIRASYPVDLRGAVTGRLRQWSAGAFLVIAMASARILDTADSWRVVQALLVATAVLHTMAYLAVSRIRVSTDALEDADVNLDAEAEADGADPAGVPPTYGSVAATIRKDARFLRYLVGCFLFGVGALTYDPILRAYFSHELGLNYTQSVVLADVLPSVCSVLSIHRLGSWLDRTNPLRAWAAIRFTWSLDPIILALAPALPVQVVATAAVARLFRGSVMGGSWILWWQLGTNYFARRQALTSVYMGLHISLNGVQRVCGPPLGAILGGVFSRRGVLLVGGLLVLWSALHAWRQAEAEKVDGRYPTFADTERANLAS